MPKYTTPAPYNTHGSAPPATQAEPSVRCRTQADLPCSSRASCTLRALPRRRRQRPRRAHVLPVLAARGQTTRHASGRASQRNWHMARPDAWDAWNAWNAWIVRRQLLRRLPRRARRAPTRWPTRHRAQAEQQSCARCVTLAQAAAQKAAATQACPTPADPIK